MIKLLKSYPFFLVLLPCFILLHVETGYHNLIDYRFVVKEIALLFAIPFIVYGLVFLAVRSFPKANLFSIILLLTFFFLGELKDILRIHWPTGPFQKYTVLVPAVLVIICLMGWLIWRTRRDLRRLVLFFNVIFVLFILVEIAGLQQKRTLAAAPAIGTFEPCRDCATPDIYYILFDGYASSEILRQDFGFSNDTIEGFLHESGFRVIPHSRSNYNLTPFSISSIFDLSYLPRTDTSIDYYLRNYLPATQAVYNSALPSLLKKQGYNFINHSIFNFAGHPSTVKPFDIWKISKLYQQHNILKKMDNEIGWQYPSWLHVRISPWPPDYTSTRDAHDSAALRQLFATIDEKRTKPAFVYTHIFIPHSPYSFDSAGHNITPSFDMSVAEDKAAYVQQLQHVNTLMRQIVTAIQRKSPPAVIIIQGDHGYRFFDNEKKEAEFHNFNAMYFPSGDYHLLNDSLTSVNTFRVVFNSLFHQQYPVLDDHFFFLKYK
jgi:Sulfatase